MTNKKQKTPEKLPIEPEEANIKRANNILQKSIGFF